jgi:hypothetical protein
MGNYHVRFCSRAAGATSPLRHLCAETRVSEDTGRVISLSGVARPAPAMRQTNSGRLPHNLVQSCLMSSVLLLIKLCGFRLALARSNK